MATAKWCVEQEMKSGYDELQGVFAVEKVLNQCLALWPRLNPRWYRNVVLKTIESRMRNMSKGNNPMANFVSSVGSLKYRYLASDVY